MEEKIIILERTFLEARAPILQSSEQTCSLTGLPSRLGGFESTPVPKAAAQPADGTAHSAVTAAKAASLNWRVH